MKKLIAIIFLVCAFTISVSAFNISNITPSDEFIVYSENQTDVANILKTTETELAKTVTENSILYLAVNSNNTKQIQLKCKETDFSHSISNLNNLSDDSINTLLPQIAGLDNVKGETVYKGEQKFIKLNLQSQKNDNEYILTQFITVIEKKMYILSFYTDVNESTEYIDKAFSVTEHKENLKNDKDYSLLKTAVICATIIFGLVCVILIFTIIKDLIHRKDEQEEETDENENTVE